MIRPAKVGDTDHILRLTVSCARHMIERGIYQWNESYPSRQHFEKDIDRGDLHVMEHEGKLIGCISLTTLMDEEYRDVSWLTPDGNNLYVHRLAILPQHQGKGYASQLMAFAEDKAKQDGFVSIRLDTFSKNQANQRFYETRGYKRLGEIYFLKQSKDPFYCYELLL